MRVFLPALLCLATVLRLSAVETGEPPAELQFKTAYQVLSKADVARDAGEDAQAGKLYREALDVYMRLARKYPDWQPGVVRFRVTYCNNQLEALLKKIDGRLLHPTKDGPAPAPSPTPPTGSAAIQAQARELIMSGDSDKARTLLMGGLRDYPDDISIRLLVATVSCQAGDFADAQDLVDRVIAEAPLNATAHVLKSTVCFGLGRSADAEKELRKALEINPSLGPANYDMARLLLVSNPTNRTAAAAFYKKAKELGVACDDQLERLLKSLSENRLEP